MGYWRPRRGCNEIIFITSIIVKCVYYFRRPANSFSHISITLVARGGLSESAHDGGEHPLQCDTAHGPSCRPGELNSTRPPCTHLLGPSLTFGRLLFGPLRPSKPKPTAPRNRWILSPSFRRPPQSVTDLDPSPWKQN